MRLQGFLKRHRCKLVGIACGLLAIPVALLSFLALFTPISPSGAGYLAGLWLLVVGGVVGCRRPRGWLLMVAGVAGFVGVALWRMGQGPVNERVYMITLPGERPGRVLNRLVDEQDVALFGFRVSRPVGMVTAREAENLQETFVSLYDGFREEGALAASPFLATYLGLQRPGGFDALVFEPPVGEADTGIIFLHGFGGNFVFECGLVGRAGRAAEVLTVCPSTRWIGDWWSPAGEETVRITLDYLHGRGIERIFLGGLSNGGFGASELAPRFREELAGLILISGVSPEAVDTGLPALVIHSDGDERIPLSWAQRFVAASGEQVTLAQRPGDHFLLAKEAEWVAETMREWLSAQGE